jgi:ALIX V-shaped domain binding to HIV
VAAEDLDRIERQLDDESEEDARLRQQHGSAWNRPSSAALNSALREKAAGYRCTDFCVFITCADVLTPVQRRTCSQFLAWRSVSLSLVLMRLKGSHARCF